MLLHILTNLGVHWIVEQPANSLLEFHARWQQFCSLHRVYRIHIYMSDFGGETSKPTWLYSNAKDVEEIVKYKVRFTHGSVAHGKEMCKKYVDASGNNKVAGGKDLKASQTYPRGFGEAWARLMDDHCEDNARTELSRRARIMQTPNLLDKLIASLDNCKGDSWADARVPEVMRALF